MTIQIWHNPRCSKSRQTLELLKDNGHEPQVIEYLKEDISEDMIRETLAQLGIPAAQLLRTKEAEYKEAGLSKDSDEGTIIAAMVTYPKLIERPIVVSNGKAKIGRPPESVLDIL